MVFHLSARVVACAALVCSTSDAAALPQDSGPNKLRGALAEQLRAAPTTPVVFWLERPAAQPDLREILDAGVASGLTGEDARHATLEVAAVHTRRATEPFRATLVDAGVAITYIDPYVPLVFVTLSEADVRRWAGRPDVDSVYYAAPDWGDEDIAHEGLDTPNLIAAPNEFASPSARTDFVHRKGINGAGVKVMVNDTSGVTTSNPFLPPVIRGNPTASVRDHATAVAGIIASMHPQHTGAAPGLTELYSWGGSGDVNAPMAWSWGMQQGISFGNCSWWNFQRGGINFLDRYFDHIIRNFGVMMFKSCGNQGNGRPVTTPGNGYNMTSSGNVSDADTTTWDDDQMSSSSSTANPVEGHEKPEISSHGSGITTTGTSSPWIRSAGSGTSYASPIACGTAALLAQTDPVLTAKPEAVKALLMAGAWNNIEGDAALSDFDGAGAIDAAASQRAVEDGQFVSTTLTAASFVGGRFEHTVRLDAGDETRIVALWLSVADSTFSTDTLAMDLDMTVLDPAGAVVASRASGLDPFEIVQFVPQSSGDFTVRMQRQRFGMPSEPFALAWTTRQDAATDRVALVGSGRAGTPLTFEWSDPYHPNGLFIGFMSATPYPATMRLGSRHILPMGYDGLSAATFAGLPGFFGALDAQGRATSGFVVPPIPQLSITVGMFTFDAGLVVETSETVGITVGG